MNYCGDIAAWVLAQVNAIAFLGGSIFGMIVWASIGTVRIKK